MIMKTTLLTLTTAIAFGTSVQAQTMADALNNKCQVTWIGLDFSEAKLIPTVEFATVEADPGTAILKWNNLLEQEHEKFDLAKALGISNVVTNTSYVAPVNEGVKSQDLLSRTAITLDKEKVPSMVKKYKTNDGDGVGVVFVVSAFNKTSEIAEFYVTFFNMKTREVLHSERISGKPTGFGIRNYWAGAVTQVLKTIEKEYSKAWLKRFQ